MKRLFKWMLRLILLVIALLVLLILFKDSILRAATERRIRAKTGMDVKIGKFSSSLLSPVVNIEHLKLYNTAEFGGGPFLEVAEIHAELDPFALLRRKLRVTLMRFNLAELDVVKNEAGQTNVMKLLAKGPKQVGRASCRERVSKQV